MMSKDDVDRLSRIQSNLAESYADDRDLNEEVLWLIGKLTEQINATNASHRRESHFRALLKEVL